MRLELIGSLRLFDSDGRAIDLPGKLGPALLAILATSRNNERARETLRAMLWPRSPDPQSSASLRSLLTDLRAVPGFDADCLKADRRSVRLANVQIVETPDDRHEFFEDAPHLGEAFEDWLIQERARIRNRAVVPAAEAAVPSRRRLCLAVYPSVVRSDDAHADVVTSRITSRIIRQACLLDMVDVIDLTAIDGEGARSVPVEQAPPDIGVHVYMTKFGSLAEIGIRAFDPGSRRVFWSASISADQSTAFLFSPDQVEEFVNQAIDSIHAASLRRMERGILKPGSPPSSIFGAVHQVLSMSVTGQERARTFLLQQADFHQSSTAAAWYAFSLAHTLGEGGDAQAATEEADAYCARALELDPGNALSLALVSHVQGFVLRRLETATQLAAMARRLSPGLAIARDLSAMNAIYRGCIEEAQGHSAAAVRLGRYSLYRPLYESSQAIAASIGGDHDLAIKTARSVLQRIPNFLAVERHLMGSLAAAGQIEESRQLAGQIRRRDPLFAPETLEDPRYPLPSPLSAGLIRQGFSLTS